MSKERIDELREALAINVNALDRDCQTQPQHIAEIGEILASLRLEAKKAKMAYDEMCSVAERQIRDNPDTFGVSKVTDASVKAAVGIHGDVHNAREKLLYAEYESEKVSAIVDGYHHRRSMLDNEVKLVLSGLYGEVPCNYSTEEKGDFKRRGRDDN